MDSHNKKVLAFLKQKYEGKIYNTQTLPNDDGVTYPLAVVISKITEYTEDSVLVYFGIFIDGDNVNSSHHIIYPIIQDIFFKLRDEFETIFNIDLLDWYQDDSYDYEKHQLKENHDKILERIKREWEGKEYYEGHIKVLEIYKIFYLPKDPNHYIVDLLINARHQYTEKIFEIMQSVRQELENYGVNVNFRYNMT
jgi:hypothetical protein